MNNKVLYGIIIILTAVFIWMYIKLEKAEKAVKDLEFSLQVMVQGRTEELGADKRIAEIKIKDIQVVVDSLKKADSIEDIKFKKTSLYYERKIKELKSITTVVGIDHIRDSILRANGVRK